MPAKKHLHTYRRSKLNKEYYQCVDSECSHYLHRKLLAGKKALCMCGREFILDYESLRRATPKCSFCSRSKGAKKIQLAANIMDNILGGKEVPDMPSDKIEQKDEVEVNLEPVPPVDDEDEEEDLNDEELDESDDENGALRG